MNANDRLRKAVIVAAHPDDEVLWFSSILDKVGEIVVCFLGVKSEPETSGNRQRSLSDHPLKNISCLGLNESETFYGVDWEDPVRTPYGIGISDKKYPDTEYRNNYGALKELLKERLPGCRNVVTHNPWGEYGNDEHIQIYKVVKDLQQEIGFDMWFSNYVSNKSCGLMADYFTEHNVDYVTFQTNKELAYTIKELYKKHNCWTWYDDWEWFDSESFLQEEKRGGKKTRFGRAFPLNFITVWKPTQVENKSGILHRCISRMLK